MREVAQLAGVAMSSVSRVLSGHPDVSAAMQARVLAAVAELGYQPDLLAQSLRRQETMTIGFAVGDISNPLFAQIVATAESHLRGAGYSMLLTNSEASGDLDATHIGLLAQRRVDGIILSLSDERNPETLAALERLDVPVVLLDRDVDVPGAVHGYTDHRPGMRQAVAHLLDLGHRNIAMISGQAMRPVRERRAALEACYAERGLPETYTLVDGTFSVDFGARAAGELLSLDDPPTAIIAGGNQLLIGCLRVLTEAGLRVPDDVSLVTCDEVPLSELYRPPIATISRDTVGLGRTAAELLLHRLGEHGGPPETVVLPTQFTVRESVAAPAAVTA
jgi:LacI family transcriptional regulator